MVAANFLTLSLRVRHFALETRNTSRHRCVVSGVRLAHHRGYLQHIGAVPVAMQARTCPAAGRVAAGFSGRHRPAAPPRRWVAVIIARITDSSLPTSSYLFSSQESTGLLRAEYPARSMPNIFCSDRPAAAAAAAVSLGKKSAAVVSSHLPPPSPDPPPFPHWITQAGVSVHEQVQAVLRVFRCRTGRRLVGGGR